MVIAIIGILAAILFPVFAYAEAAAKKTQAQQPEADRHREYALHGRQQRQHHDVANNLNWSAARCTNVGQ